MNLRIFFRLFAFLTLLFAPLLWFSCQESQEGGARAFLIKERESLIGGPMAAANLNDYILENARIRVAISRPGISEAFGLFGGNVIDADRTRSAMAQGNSAGGRGFDTLVEFFPLFFLSAVDTQQAEILNDGKDGQAAKIRVQGQGASFIALTEQLNNLLIFMGGKNRLGFWLDYSLEKGKNYVRLDTTIFNQKDTGYNFESFGGVVPSVNGIVGLFGKRNRVFIPGLAAYNIRFSLEKIFETRLNAPAIPGLIGDFVGSQGEGGVNYGIVALPDEANYVYTNQNEFNKLNKEGKPKLNIDQGSLIVPLEGSSITGCFTKTAPTLLTAQGRDRDRFSYTVFLVIGDGSVSSIRDAQLEIHQKPYGMIGGQVFEQGTQIPLRGARVMAYQGSGVEVGDRLFYSDFVTDQEGRFQGRLEPGSYTLLARLRNEKSQPIEVTIEKDQRKAVQMLIPREAMIAFTIRDTQGRLLPSKATALAQIKDFEGGRCIGKNPIGCLYDLHLDDPELATDFRVGRTCSDGKACRGKPECKGIGDQECIYRLAAETEYREDFAVTANGQGLLRVRPGTYKVVASRGIEYELSEQIVTVQAGEVRQIEFTLQHSAPTPRMLSGDFHVHTNFSHDVSIDDRVHISAYAAEGVDFFVVTDHNRIRDLKPIAMTLGLDQWLHTVIGVEMTTFEMGHFNAFPLRIDVASFTGGSPNWFKKDDRYENNEGFPVGTSRVLEGFRQGIPPKELFDSLRKRGSISPEETIIQVNHPRDSIFGYFNTYSVSPDDARPVYKSGLSSPLSREFDIDKYEENFDAIEIFNSKELGLIWHWRIPKGAKAPEGYGGDAYTTIRKDEGGKAEVAYPGGGDDWFNLLNLGKVYTATANSDSHGFMMEAGSPRNYLLTGFDHPQQLKDQTLVQLIRERKLIMTNGPVVEVEVAAEQEGPFFPIGSTVNAQGKDRVFMRIRVSAPSWMDVSEIVVYQEGRIVRSIPIPESKTPERFSFNQILPFDIERDAWFVVTVKGARGDLWPVIAPTEYEPFQIGQAVGLIQDTLLASFPVSLNLSSDTCLAPTRSRLVMPYAITNPIWVDRDGDGKYTPDPCKTLGDQGVFCRQQGSTCSDGVCLSARACTEDKTCEPDQRCINNRCTINACKDIKCSPAFEACADDKGCADDSCPAQDRVCANGRACSIDTECNGIGDGFCRYCRCPQPRGACRNGAPCQSDTDCPTGDSCAQQRFCKPTACALGRCVPTYPICKGDEISVDAHIFLRNKKDLQASFPPHISLDRLRAEYHRIPTKDLPQDDRYAIRQVGSFFLFFEHRH